MKYHVFFNSLPDEKILVWSKLKAFADDKFNVPKMMISFLERVGNIVRKGKNASWEHFLFFPQCFQMLSVSGSLKLGIMRYRVNTLPDGKILDCSKLRAFADDKMKGTKTTWPCIAPLADK